MADMTIGKFAQAGSVGVETVRYYQRKGLLGVPKPIGRQGRATTTRRYGTDDLRKLLFIRSAQTAGFSLAQIKELLELDANTDRHRARSLAKDRIASLTSRIVELEAMRATLSYLHDSCVSHQQGPCPILVAFDAHSVPASQKPKVDAT